MNLGDADAWVPRCPSFAGRMAASIRGASNAWRALRWVHFRWTFSVGTVVGLLFLVSNSSRKISRLLGHRSSVEETLWECAIALSVSITAAFIFLLGVSLAEKGDHGQPRAWIRYAVATLASVGMSTALVHALTPRVPVAALVAWYPAESQRSIDTFVFANFLLLGGLAVFVYVRLRRVKRIQAAFERVELARASAGRQVLTSRLAAMQAQVEPTFLFSTLAQIEALYKRDVAGADQMLDDLIDYLRAALPQLRGEPSTLARECELADAWLRIVRRRMGSRLEFEFAIAPDVETARFSPMLLLPLIDNAIRHGLEPLPLGGKVEIGAAGNNDRLWLTISDNGVGDPMRLREGSGLISLRERLAGLYGRDATLALHAARPHGITATIEVPRHDGPSDHR